LQLAFSHSGEITQALDKESILEIECFYRIIAFLVRYTMDFKNLLRDKILPRTECSTKI